MPRATVATHCTAIHPAPAAFCTCGTGHRPRCAARRKTIPTCIATGKCCRNCAPSRSFTRAWRRSSKVRADGELVGTNGAKNLTPAKEEWGTSWSCRGPCQRTGLLTQVPDYLKRGIVTVVGHKH